MAERRATPRARLTISCLESEWERIREVAESRGVSINDHVISAGLNVELDPAQTDAPALALSEAEQRRLLDRVDRLAESMLSAASGGSIARLLQSVELLLMTTLHDLVWQGRVARARASAGGGVRPRRRAGCRTAVPGLDGEQAAAARLTGAALVLGRVPGRRGAGAHPGCCTSHADASAAVGAPMTRCQGLLLDLLRRVENALAPGLVGPGGAEAAARGDLPCGPPDRAAGLRRAGA